MTYNEFQLLVKGGEKDRVDFKIHCAAFDTKDPDCSLAKAELAKDVCAMANNGNFASYIIIGVSDDRKHFKSLGNSHLTDDNIQSFLKSAISPPVSVKLEVNEWRRVPNAAKGKRFAIIKIGPNARHAYRLNQNFIDLNNPDLKRRYHFRKNEVWVRRGATSDLAAPEEIARLLRVRTAEQSNQAEGNLEYSRIPVEEQSAAVISDFRKLIDEFGWKHFPEDSGHYNSFRIVIPLHGKNYVLRCAVDLNLHRKNKISNAARELWKYEHGFVFLQRGALSKSAVPLTYKIHFKDNKWGWMSAFTLQRYGRSRYFGNRQTTLSDILLPTNFEPPDLTVFTLPQLHDTNSLRDRFTALVACLRDDPDLLSSLKRSRQSINNGLKGCLKEGWVHEYPMAKPPRKHVGGEPIQPTIRDLTRLAKQILRLSA